MNNFQKLAENTIKELELNLRKQTINSFFLTGGTSAKALYKMLKSKGIMNSLKSTNFFFGDERCVPPHHPASNYNMVRSIFLDYIPTQNFKRIYADTFDPITEAKRYNDFVPDSVDFILLSVGEDGHIASLFPNSLALRRDDKITFVSDSNKPPTNRISITPKVILNAKNVMVLVSGKNKAKILIHALNNPNNFESLPVCLTIGRTWILDEEASNFFLKFAPSNKLNTKLIYA